MSQSGNRLYRKQSVVIVIEKEHFMSIEENKELVRRFWKAPEKLNLTVPEDDLFESLTWGVSSKMLSQQQ